MFIGHFAVGLGAKKIRPEIKLGTLFLASQFIDLLWPVFLLLGLENVRVEIGNTVVTPLNFYHYPLTHSLVGVLFWALLLGACFYAIRKSVKGAIILGVLVLSHWLLDLIAHRPDLPLLPGSGLFVGLGLWDNFYASLILELALFALGLMLYLRATKSIDKIGNIALYSLAACLLIISLSDYYGPPPPDNPALIGMVGLAQLLFIPWGYWIDRHRRAS
ncbi:MAG: metal-dependent hydrolase [Candidatus Zixiibacteriota bacterium]